MMAVQYIRTQPKRPLSPEKFFPQPARVREAGGGFIDIPANRFAKRVEGRWIFIPITGPRPPLLLNELMAQPGQWVPLDSLKAQVAPGGLFCKSALAVAAHGVRACFTNYFCKPPAFLRPQTAARLKIELPDRIETRGESARWLMEA